MIHHGHSTNIAFYTYEKHGQLQGCRTRWYSGDLYADLGEDTIWATFYDLPQTICFYPPSPRRSVFAELDVPCLLSVLARLLLAFEALAANLARPPVNSAHEASA